MRFPNPEKSFIGRKLEDYVPNRSHREVRHKARVFESVLGITSTNQEILRQAILHAASTSDTVESQGDVGHVSLYVLRFPLHTKKGRAVVLTAWIVRYGEDSPRLITCYIL